VVKIILNSDVPNLGEEGDVKEVADGYARNYLLPKKFAVPFNKQNLAVFESRKASIEKRKLEKRNDAKSLKEKIEAANLIIERPVGDKGKLFGSINNAVIADELEKIGISIERKKIEIPENTIKVTGNYQIKIKLYEKETAVLAIVVNAAAKK
jgi:large subunit ribosomal protein L9